MRGKRLAKNTVTALIVQITTIICGFILPRLILGHFGSEVNGLVNSITQFISIIAFLDLGVGAVFQSTLYKPLAEKDNEKISEIYVSGQKFFVRLGEILIVYVFLLMIIYPNFAGKEFGFIYTSTLIGAISISSFAQYFLGMANGLFISADQRAYIPNTLQFFTIVTNTAACYILIKLGASIHLVKLTTSLCYLVRPILLDVYIRKNYQINRRIKYKGEPISQKWNGLAQHIASVVLESTDTIVLTLFASLSDVSIYSVYYLVISGLKQLFTSITTGIQALIGELYVKQEHEALVTTFGWTEWIIHTTATFVFGCTASLIIPFVMVYTNGVNDANYNRPLFSILIVLAYLIYTYRLPYHIAIKAAVHYKQTQICYAVAAFINIGVSVLAVWKFGLVGVAIGTLIAMSYQTLWMAFYNSKNIVMRPMGAFWKQVLIDIITFVVGMFATKIIQIAEYTYLKWIVEAIEISILWGAIVIIINFIFYPGRLKELLKRIIKVRGN